MIGAQLESTPSRCHGDDRSRRPYPGHPARSHGLLLRTTDCHTRTGDGSEPDAAASVCEANSWIRLCHREAFLPSFPASRPREHLSFRGRLFGLGHHGGCT